MINDYEHVLIGWNTYKIKTMRDYYDLYLKYVLVLAVFEKNRNSTLKNYGMCQSHYLSAAPLS